MKIIGPDFLVFGVDDLAACRQFLVDYGLRPVDVSERGGTFVALDGTGVQIRHKDDPALPPALDSGNRCGRRFTASRTAPRSTGSRTNSARIAK